MIEIDEDECEAKRITPVAQEDLEGLSLLKSQGKERVCYSDTYKGC